MIQIFLDTNIWIDYCLNKHISKKGLRFKKRNVIPVHKINSRLAKVTITEPLLYEITSHFKDFYLSQDAINRGYGFSEFRAFKRKAVLKQDDRKKVDDIYQSVSSYPATKDQYFYNWLDEKRLNFVFLLSDKYDIEFIDCLHFISAIFDKCDIFVTKDEKLIESIKKASKRYSSFRKMKVIQPKEFLSTYSTKIMKK